MAELYRRLREVGRSEKSIEWKQRVGCSGVARDRLDSGPVAHNSQDSLSQSVEVRLGLHPKILTDPVPLKPRFMSSVTGQKQKSLPALKTFGTL